MREPTWAREGRQERFVERVLGVSREPRLRHKPNGGIRRARERIENAQIAFSRR
jgi:hypothetical protein